MTENRQVRKNRPAPFISPARQLCGVSALWEWCPREGQLVVERLGHGEESAVRFSLPQVWRDLDQRSRRMIRWQVIDRMRSLAAGRAREFGFTLNTKGSVGQAFKVRGEMCRRSDNTIAIRGFVEPVQLRQRNLRGLHLANKELKAIFDAVPTRVWVKDRHNRILRLNQSAARSMNGEVSDFEGQCTYELFPEMAAKYHAQDLEVIDSHKAQMDIIEEYTPADGERGWVRTSKVPYHDAETGEDRILVMAEDITQQKRAESLARKAKERFTMAERIAGIGHWQLNVDKGELIWSEQVYAIHGVTPETYTPDLTTAIEWYHEDDRQTVTDAVNSLIEFATPYDVMGRIRDAKGRERVVRALGARRKSLDTKQTIIFGVFQDVTDQEEVHEEVRRYAAALESANRELERFAVVASHDLQEPLRKIASFAGLLQADCADQLSQDGAQYLDYMTDAASRMQQMIRDLLEFSRSGSELALEKTDLNALLAEMAREVAQSHHVDIESFQLQIMPVIEADALGLCQVFRNLFSNCVKYRSSAPLHVTVTSACVGDQLSIHVSDNGIGFAQERAEHLFQLFARLHRKEDIPGTGMGLAICERIIRAHGGTITARSNPGEGATFTINLPARPGRLLAA
jgi:PAS domain S-box-containing protein